MAQTRGWFVAILMALSMFACSGSEYRFGNTQRVLNSITVTPTGQTLTAPGQTAQFIATGNYSVDPPTQELTSQAQWSSSAPSIMTVNSNGVATAVATGTATITATFNGATGSATVTVDIAPPPPTRTLTSITVVPSSQTLMTVGEDGQFIGVGNYSSAPLTQEITTQVVWSSSDKNVAEAVGAGLVRAKGGGSATITAANNGVVGTATLTVTATVPPPRQLTSITVIPSSQTTVTVGQTAQFIAIGNYIGNPATQDLTSQVTWTSSAISVATVNTSGLATTLSPGTATITALDKSGVAGTATLTASSKAVPNQLTAINIIPSAQTAMTIGDLGQFIAIGSYTGSPSTANVTTTTTWASSAPGVASVNGTGLVTAIGPGTATITASGDGNSGTAGIVGSAILTVSATLPPGELTAITVIPGNQTTLWIPETIQFLAIGTFNSIPYTRDITNQVQWSSSDTFAITIDATGLAATANTTPGSTIVAKGTALSGAVITGTATVGVQPSGGPGLPVLTVFLVGGNFQDPLISVVNTNSAPPIIDCVPGGSSCSGVFASHTVVTLVANVPQGHGFFGGFSLNCTPVVPDPNANACKTGPQVPSCTCQVHMENSQSVGAIFNLF